MRSLTVYKKILLSSTGFHYSVHVWKIPAFRDGLLVTFLSVSCAVSCFKLEYGAYTLFLVSYFEQISLKLGKRSMAFSQCLCQVLLYVGAESLYVVFTYYFSEPEVSGAEVA